MCEGDSTDVVLLTHTYCNLSLSTEILKVDIIFMVSPPKTAMFGRFFFDLPSRERIVEPVILAHLFTYTFRRNVL